MVNIRIFRWRWLQTHHVDSTLKRLGNDRFHVVSPWNPRGVFIGEFNFRVLFSCEYPYEGGNLHIDKR